MKKITFTLLGFSSLMILSCRQEEDLLNTEDLNSLKVLEKVQSRKSEKTNISPVSDTISIGNVSGTVSNRLLSDDNMSSIDGEIKQPPK